MVKSVSDEVCKRTGEDGGDGCSGVDTGGRGGLTQWVN